MNDHPYYGDKDNYFPTLKLMNSYNFGPIDVDPSKREKLVMWEELNFGLDNVAVKDDPLLMTERDAGFLNLKSTREGIEARTNFPFENPDEERLAFLLKLIQMTNKGEKHERKST